MGIISRLLLACVLWIFADPSLVLGQNGQLPATGVWNGFLNQENIVECGNLSEQTVSLALTITDYQGQVIDSISFELSAKGTKHILLNPYGISDSYGSFRVESVGGSNSVRVTCVNSVYRFAAPGSPKSVEYAYSLPILPPLTGVSAGVFNSFDPSLQTQPVFNFLSVYNLDQTAFSADVEVYSQDGTLDQQRSFRLEGLAPNERRDFALGHESGQVVGIYRVVPDDPSLLYGALLSRYGSNGLGGYTFAFPLFALTGDCHPGPVPASTMDPATNWGEVANPTAQAVEARIRIIDRNGNPLLDEVRTIPPFSQHHTHINSYLGERNVGTFHASCNRNAPGDKLLVQSLYYGRVNNLTTQLEWAYASQAMGNITSGSSAVAVPVNSFLGMANWHKLLETQGVGAQVDLDIYGEDGTLRYNQIYQVPAGGSLDVGLHENTGSNFVGLGVFYPQENARLYPELLRVFPHSHTSIGYVMSVPGTIVDAVPRTSRDRVIADYQANFLGSSVAYNELGWTGSTSTCSAGTISQLAHQKVLQRINYFRRTAGLADDVVLDAVKNAKSQQAALMMSANHSLSHSPPASWDCYTQDGATAAGKSNLALGYHSTSAISAYMSDWGSSNYAVGHRRWILYSRAKVMGNGSTSNAQALWVIGDFKPAPADLPAFIAWPPAGYVPSPLIYGRWSFSIPGASFAGTTIEMSDEAHNPLQLEIQPIRNGYGDNTIVWEPQGVVKNQEHDAVYHVRLNNVVVNSQSRDYSYDVVIIQPGQTVSMEPVALNHELELGEAPIGAER